jgi:hypothetical protein
MREESSEQSGENIPLLSLLYFVFLGQRMQTRLPVSVSHLFSTRNIDERIGSEADRELTVCSSHFDMVTPLRSPTCALFDRDRLRASSTLSRDFSARTTEPGRAPCAPCFSTICERNPLSRREANRWSGGSRGRHSGGLRYRWHA